MKKNNRILLKIVAILLCLVLISTSIVSGIFARFVIKKGGSTAIKFNKFGVELGLTVSDEFKEFLGITEETFDDFVTTDGDSISISLPDLTMVPGDVFDKAFNISISGTPTVDCKFIFDIDLELDYQKFLIPAGLYDNKKIVPYFPIKFSIESPNADGDIEKKYISSGVKAAYEYNPDNAPLLQDLIMHSAIIEDICAIYFSEETCSGGVGGVRNVHYLESGVPIVLHPLAWSNTLSDEIVIDNVSFNSFDLGFEWPFDESDGRNAADTYIVEKNPNGLGFKYRLTLTVEQRELETELD